MGSSTGAAVIPPRRGSTPALACPPRPARARRRPWHVLGMYVPPQHPGRPATSSTMPHRASPPRLLTSSISSGDGREFRLANGTPAAALTGCLSLSFLFGLILALFFGLLYSFSFSLLLFLFFGLSFSFFFDLLFSFFLWSHIVLFLWSVIFPFLWSVIFPFL